MALLSSRAYSALSTWSSYVSGFNLHELRNNAPAEFARGWKEVLEMIVDGKLQPRIDSVWKFEDIVEASKQITERKNIGKVIIKP